MICDSGIVQVQASRWPHFYWKHFKRVFFSLKIHLSFPYFFHQHPERSSLKSKDSLDGGCARKGNNEK